MKKKIAPYNLASRIDNFFNGFHNVLFISIEISKSSFIYSQNISKKEPTKLKKKKYLFPFIFLKLFFELILNSVKLRNQCITELSDKESTTYIDKIIVNSNNVKKRVKKYYNRNSIIINPPIAISKFKYNNKKDYWLSVNRICPEKRIEIQIKAFAKLPHKNLVIIGGFDQNNLEYVKKLKKISAKNVKFIGNIDEEKLLNYYSNCKGFITTSKDEDFGMTPVEAMASGKPVIAPNEGGYKETVIDGVTGRLIDNINPDKLIDAIKEIGKNPKRYKNACLKQAKKFDTKIFIKKIKEQICFQND